MNQRNGNLLRTILYLVIKLDLTQEKEDDQLRAPTYIM